MTWRAGSAARDPRTIVESAVRRGLFAGGGESSVPESAGATATTFPTAKAAAIAVSQSESGPDSPSLAAPAAACPLDHCRAPDARPMSCGNQNGSHWHYACLACGWRFTIYA